MMASAHGPRLPWTLEAEELRREWWCWWRWSEWCAAGGAGGGWSSDWARQLTDLPADQWPLGPAHGNSAATGRRSHSRTRVQAAPSGGPSKLSDTKQNGAALAARQPPFWVPIFFFLFHHQQEKWGRQKATATEQPSPVRPLHPPPSMFILRKFHNR